MKTQIVTTHPKGNSTLNRIIHYARMFNGTVYYINRVKAYVVRYEIAPTNEFDYELIITFRNDKTKN